jgi:hypothetical protein
MVEGSRPGFLERIADSYAILAELRNYLGGTPTTRLKWWQNWLWPDHKKPAQAATSAKIRSVPA